MLTDPSYAGQILVLTYPFIGNLVELCEIANHPWIVGCQFHPEFGSRPGRPHPLFRDFIGVAKDILREGDQPPLLLSSSL
jgi:CTP synthase